MADRADNDERCNFPLRTIAGYQDQGIREPQTAESAHYPPHCFKNVSKSPNFSVQQATQEILRISALPHLCHHRATWISNSRTVTVRSCYSTVSLRSTKFCLVVFQQPFYTVEAVSLSNEVEKGGTWTVAKQKVFGMPNMLCSICRGLVDLCIIDPSP